MSNLSLLTIGDYYNYSYDKMMEGKMETGQGYGLGIDGCKKLCPAATGHSLVTLLSLSVSVKDRPLHKSRGKSQIYYPEHILVYGCLEDLLLSFMGFGSFRIDCHGFFLVEEVLAPH